MRIDRGDHAGVAAHIGGREKYPPFVGQKPVGGGREFSASAREKPSFPTDRGPRTPAPPLAINPVRFARMIDVGREYRSPHRLWGWVTVVFAAIGTTAFFLGVDWSEFEGRLVDYINLAKVPISAVILAGLGLHVALCTLVTTDSDIFVRNIFRSARWRWAEVLRITEDEKGVLRVESRGEHATRICALGRVFPVGQRRRWQTAAIEELWAMFESRKAAGG